MSGQELEKDFLVQRRSKLPKSFDVEQMSRNRDLWNTAVESVSISYTNYNTDAIGSFPVSEVLDCIFANSPYLSRIALKDPETVARLSGLGPNEAWDTLMLEFQSQAFCTDATSHSLMKVLRNYKQRAALHIAVCDITSQWSLFDVVGRLSDFADATVKAALQTLLLAEADKGNVELSDPGDPLSNSGVFVLGLGKLGARELNYSSDIDLMFLYDHDRVPYTGPKTTQEFAVKLAKGLIKLLDERTQDGYVFRTDMRLRPDPSSTSIAVSTEAAELYYESWGQNWERAALLKARCIAGDTNAAKTFLSSLEPFIWRKSLDFYAIQDIHSVKRQIYANKGGATIDVLGHNIKTGRGGIREIEFFVQIQQLIWGGRRPNLRVMRTVDGLHKLYEEEQVSAEVRDELTQSYLYLRTLEHRMQMINDEQTQTIPADTDKARALALFFGNDDLDSFERDVRRHLLVVESHYADLFEDTPSLAVEGNLVFTGTDHDADTLKTLERMGYTNPTAVSQLVKSWHQGKIRATRSTRARQLLTELMPAILTAFSKTAQPDRAFLNFDQSLAKLPAGVQLFSVFYSNPEILDLIAEIMGDAPRLADYLTSSTHRLDYVLDPSFYDDFPSEKELYQDLQDSLQPLNYVEQKLETCVRWTNDLRFRAGVLVLREIITPEAGSAALTSIADVVIQSVIPIIWDEYKKKFGVIENSSLAILAYGKLASKELMPTSDLDLVIIYDAHQDAHATGTERTLPASAYFIRLAQRIVSTLSAQTSEGRLYEIDLRLRPSGDQGPFANSLESFKKYQLSDAWVWEHLALTKARVVFSTDEVGSKLENIIRAVLAKPKSNKEISVAISEMRKRISGEHASVSYWDIKRMSGGLTDTEFLIQLYALSSGLAGQENWPASTLGVIDFLVQSNHVSLDEGSTLKRAFHLWMNIMWLLRLSLDHDQPIKEVPLGLQERIARISNIQDSNELVNVILDTRQQISRLIDQNIPSV